VEDGRISPCLIERAHSRILRTISPAVATNLHFTDPEQEKWEKHQATLGRTQEIVGVEALEFELEIGAFV